MPIYEYACEKCGCTSEVVHKHDEIFNTICDVCLEKDGSVNKMEKQMSVGGFRLKGTGWYNGNSD